MTHTMRMIVHRRIQVCVALLCLVYFAGAVGAQTQNAQVPDWKSYSFPADGFSASFPSLPSLQKQSVTTAASAFELRAYVVQDSTAAVFVGVCDYGATAQGRDPDLILNGAQNGAITNLSGHLISGKKITLGINHGVAFEAESDSMHVSARIYLVGTTIYQTLVPAPLGQPYTNTTRFLDSFQLITRAQN